MNEMTVKIRQAFWPSYTDDTVISVRRAQMHMFRVTKDADFAHVSCQDGQYEGHRQV